MKFLVDFMLGRLARELRLLGFDTLYPGPDKPINLLTKARKEGRVLITRNSKLKGMGGVEFLSSENLHEQIRALFKKFNLKSKIKPFSRCLLCNEKLEGISKEKIQGSVPFFVYRTINNFSKCPKCGRIYWKGSHYQNMERRIKRILQDVSHET